MNEYQIIAVDFDGTLCSDCYPEIGEANIPLVQELKENIKRGNRIILWSCRCGERLEEAIRWCSDHGLQFDAVNENIPEVLKYYGSDSRKIYADIYIDDRAYNFKTGRAYLF